MNFLFFSVVALYGRWEAQVRKNMFGKSCRPRCIEGSDEMWHSLVSVSFSIANICKFARGKGGRQSKQMLLPSFRLAGWSGWRGQRRLPMYVPLIPPAARPPQHARRPCAWAPWALQVLFAVGWGGGGGSIIALLPHN